MKKTLNAQLSDNCCVVWHLKIESRCALVSFTHTETHPPSPNSHTQLKSLHKSGCCCFASGRMRGKRGGAAQKCMLHETANRKVINKIHTNEH